MLLLLSLPHVAHRVTVNLSCFFPNIENFADFKLISPSDSKYLGISEGKIKSNSSSFSIFSKISLNLPISLPVPSKPKTGFL